MSTTGLEPDRTAPTNGLVAVDGRTFPLRGASVRARAEGGVAKTTFVQSYTNPYSEPLEVLYTLPLPADGSVIGYTIHLGEKVITGRIETREQARETYQRALEHGHTAGLLEQERADTFTQTLGCLPPEADVRVEIDVLHPLAFRPRVGDGPAHWEYRFPTVVGVRYEGAPGRVPDAERLDVERADASGTPARLEVQLEVGDGESSQIALESTSHRVRVEANVEASTEANTASTTVPDASERISSGSLVSLVEPSPLDRDVVVRWTATESSVGVRLKVGSGLEGDDGRYGLITITPPAREETTFARDLTLLIDASGSMGGPPIKRAKEVAAHLLRSLTSGDRFELIAFASEPQELVRGPMEANEKNIRTALALLGRLQAGGATEMANAIEHALRPLRLDSQRQVVLFTDGYIGFESQVIRKVLEHLPDGARLHTVGIGRAPNRTLTHGAARAGRGIELVVDDDKVAKEAAERLQQATVAPVLTDLVIGGSAVQGVAPERPRDVLAGQPLVASVELDPQGGSIEVSGRLAGESERWWARLAVGSASDNTTATATATASTGTTSSSADSHTETQIPVGALFGREAIEDQEMILAAAEAGGRQAAEILSQIEALGLRHRIASRRTSLVAVSEDPTVDPSDPRRRERLVVELPAEVSAEGVGLAGTSLMDTLLFAKGPGLRRGVTELLPEDAVFQLAEPPSFRFLRRSRAPIPPEVPTPMDKDETTTPMTEIAARLVRVEDNLLVVEFEAPHDRFALPAGGATVRVRLGDGREIKAWVEGALSTRVGPHAAGLTLRLGLRMAEDTDWPTGETRLFWTVGRARSTSITMVVHIK
jgi:Ca-activated chloride channel family protein